MLVSLRKTCGEGLDVHFSFHRQRSEVRWIKLDHTGHIAEQTFHIRNHEMPDRKSCHGMTRINRPPFHSSNPPFSASHIAKSLYLLVFRLPSPRPSPQRGEGSVRNPQLQGFGSTPVRVRYYNIWIYSALIPLHPSIPVPRGPRTCSAWPIGPFRQSRPRPGS